MRDFGGVKAAVMVDEELLVYLRDNTPGLEFANQWDFPGGGREGPETPVQTLIRETMEEFGFMLKKEQIIWQKEYPAMRDPNQKAWFMVVKATQEQVASIQFGDEGQYWKLMSIEEFLAEEQAVSYLKVRLQDYLNER